MSVRSFATRPPVQDSAVATLSPSDARRFEVGSPSYICLVGATEAIRLLLRSGMKNVENRILELSGYLIDSLKELGLNVHTPEKKDTRAGIISFQIERAVEVVEKMSGKIDTAQFAFRRASSPPETKFKGFVCERTCSQHFADAVD